MSANVKTNQQNVLPSQRAQAPQTVGQDYRSRSKYLSGASVPQKTVDQFRRHDPRAEANTASFEANAAYRNLGRVKAQGASAYKTPLHHYVENGLAPAVVSPLKKPSDKVILNFLDKIIGNQALWSETNVRRAAYAGAPAKSVSRRS